MVSRCFETDYHVRFFRSLLFYKRYCLQCQLLPWSVVFWGVCVRGRIPIYRFTDLSYTPKKK